jgi:hypothetical protein
MYLMFFFFFLALLIYPCAHPRLGFTEVDTSVAGCIAFYPVVDMVTRAPKGKPDPASFFEAKIAKKTRQEYAELFRRWSPIHLVGPGAPPFMLVQYVCHSKGLSGHSICCTL